MSSFIKKKEEKVRSAIEWRIRINRDKTDVYIRSLDGGEAFISDKDYVIDPAFDVTRLEHKQICAPNILVCINALNALRKPCAVRIRTTCRDLVHHLQRTKFVKKNVKDYVLINNLIKVRDKHIIVELDKQGRLK